jgi:hypothetical protein
MRSGCTHPQHGRLLGEACQSARVAADLLEEAAVSGLLTPAVLSRETPPRWMSYAGSHAASWQ